MFLSEIISDVEVLEVKGSVAIPVSGLKYDSRKVEPGDVFIAIPGHKEDGKKFIESALKKGASSIVVEGPLFDNLRATQVRVSGARLALAKMASKFFAHPTESFYLAGITGTNGKTTLTYLLEALWQTTQKVTGVIGTISIRYPGYEEPASQTTPDSLDLQNLFSKMREKKISHAAMEVSSHALSQYRASQCQFDSAVFTNLTQDHLDYHKNMDDYFQAKALLFERELKESKKKNRAAIVNGDDIYGKKIILGKDVTRISYGFESDCTISPTHYEINLDGIKATLKTPWGKTEVNSTLMGRFNLYNLMAAVAVAYHSGLNTSQVEGALQKFKAVPGRLERIGDAKGRLVFVDYAHTPDALFNVLKTLKDLQPKKIITVFGCGGDRDSKKRPLMGFEAGKISDMCIVTSDNPRTENPDHIISEIIPGLVKAGKKEGADFIVIADRKEALQKAVEMSNKGDVVLVAGKGHEDYQIIGTTKQHFSDQEILKSFVK